MIKKPESMSSEAKNQSEIVAAAAAANPAPDGRGADFEFPADIPQEIRDQILAPAEPAAPAPDGLSTLVLVTAGITVFDGVLLLIFMVLWLTNLDLLLGLLAGRAGFTLLLAAAPLALGAVVTKRKDRQQGDYPGAVWGRAGMMVGALLAVMSLAIPVMATMRVMLTPS